MIALAASLAWLIAFAPAARPAAAPGPGEALHASGLFRSLFTTSRSIVTGERYGDNLARLRVELAGARGDDVSYQFVADSETHVGNRIGLPDFAAVRGRDDAAWLDLRRALVDRPHLYSDLSVYRASVTVRRGPLAVTAGRQRIAWGTARFWSPADLFNPIDPLQIEGDVRPGVDAVQVEARLPGRWRTGAVYAPHGRWQESTVAGRIATLAGGWDLAGFGGRFRGDWVGGGEVAGQWGGAGLHGEVTYTWRGAHSVPALADAFRLAAGADYAWPKLYLVVEYFYNQAQPRCASIAACGAAAFRPMEELLTGRRHFTSSGATLTLTPLLEADAYVVLDLAGGSVFVNPILRYNAAPNVDLAVGAQLFAGSRQGEFGGLPRLLFARLDLHF